MASENTVPKLPYWYDTSLPVWNFGSAGVAGYYVLIEMLSLKTVRTGGTVYHDKVVGSGQPPLKETYDAIVGRIPSCHIVNKSFEDGELRLIVAVSDQAVLQVMLTEKRSELRVYASTQECFDLVMSVGREFIAREVGGSVLAAVVSDGELSFKSLGSGGKPLVRDNYTPQALEAFDTIIANMTAKTPAGRLTIVDGSPGSGKTFWVRGLLNTCEKAKFLFIAPSMIESVSGPEMLGALLHETDDGAPIVIVLEDADSCLVQRSGDNMGAIAALLNLTDGVMGSLLDIHIVATTNAKDTDFDPAILRPGRLLRKVNIGPLTPDHASQVYKRLTGQGRVWEKPTLLCEVYAAVNDPNRPKVGTAGRVGF